MDRVSYEKITIQDLLNFYKSEELDLNPWYQRRAVWTDPQKGYLINTVFEQKPVPTIYIRHTLDIEKEKSIREVVDGQQRIRSIIGYRNGEFTARHPSYKEKKIYADLKGNEKEHFLMTSLSVGYLIGATEPDVIEIFGRINSVSKTLNAQEKRNALFSGEFKQFTIKMASELLPFWRSRGIFSANEISRMAEVEFVADLAMNFNIGVQDYSPARLSNYYKNNDVFFADWDNCEKAFSGVFSLLGSVDVGAIRDTVFSRQPLLFSLCLVLKDNLSVKPGRLEEVISEIDRIISADVPINERSPEDAQFLSAITSSTQRIASRRVRDSYIRRYFE